MTTSVPAVVVAFCVEAATDPLSVAVAVALAIKPGWLVDWFAATVAVGLLAVVLVVTSAALVDDVLTTS